MWCKAVFGDVHSFHCSYCKTNLSVKAKGVSSVKNHENTEKHKKNAAAYGGQQTSFDSNGTLQNVQTIKDHLTPQDLIVRAEIIEALNSVEFNRSFQSANNDSERYKRMFPESTVAEGYSQGETKMKYNIQFGIAPYIKKKLRADCGAKPFVFLFDETTTTQVKKQYDGYVRYESSETNQIETHYCGSLFVGHCTAKDLLDHFFHFMEDLGLDMEYLLNLGMDGPNVNKKFNKDLKKELDAKETSFIDIGSCNLHAVNNSFGKAVEMLKKEGIIDLDQFAIDLHFFFKLSAARREDYEKVSEITDICCVYMMKHIQTRWLSIEKVLVRIMQQFQNLKSYFFETLPKDKNFKSDTATDKPGHPNRYNRIVQLLKSETTVAYMAFVVHSAVPFKRFMMTFQTNAPMVHLLYDEMVRLVKSVISMFVDKKAIPSKRSELVEFECSNEKIHIAKIDLGTRASACIDSLTDKLEASRFTKNAKKFLISCAEYLFEHLPLDEPTLIDVRALHPVNQMMKNGERAIKRLATNVIKVLGKKANENFQFVGEDYQLVDLIVKEYQEYTLQIIPESLFKKEEERPSSSKENARKQYSYWQEAYREAGVENTTTTTTEYKRIDVYWRSIGELLDSSGKRMFFHLSVLAKTLLLLTHGNADPERGFSLNKNLLAIHGTTINEDTIVAIRMVKDFISHKGGTLNVEINKEMIASSRFAWSRYNIYLENKREEERIKKKLEEEQAAAKEAAEMESEKTKKRKEKKEQIELDIAMWEAHLEASEQLLRAANEEMKTLLGSGNALVVKDVRLCHSKSEIALKRKGESETELSSLKKKVKKYS